MTLLSAAAADDFLLFFLTKTISVDTGFLCFLFVCFFVLVSVKSVQKLEIVKGMDR